MSIVDFGSYRDWKTGLMFSGKQVTTSDLLHEKEAETYLYHQDRISSRSYNECCDVQDNIENRGFVEGWRGGWSPYRGN